MNMTESVKEKLMRRRYIMMKEKRMIKRFWDSLLCLFVALSVWVIPAFAASEDHTNDSLIVGVPVNRCPIFYYNDDTNEITGIGVDLMRLAAGSAGYDVTFRPIEEKTLKDALDNSSYDVIMPFGSAIASTSGKPCIVSENLLQTPFTLVTTGNRTLPPLNDLHVGMLSSLAAGAETVRQL